MRNSAKIVFFLVLVAFAGFMVLQGLISIFSDPTQGGRVAPQGVIGRLLKTFTGPRPRPSSRRRMNPPKMNCRGFVTRSGINSQP
jgi:hypothetical protein